MNVIQPQRRGQSISPLASGSLPALSFAPQRSPGWRRARLGKVTASRISELVARTKTGWSTSRGAYMNQLLVERLTGSATLTPQTPAMRWGAEQEDLARAAYAFRTDRDALAEGFVDHPLIDMSGASPDGLVGNSGLVEIKCPTTATHLETLSSGEVPSKYLAQMHWQLACTGRGWCDFVSFDPRLPEPMRVFIRRVDHDRETVQALEACVAEFLEELDAKILQLRSTAGKVA